MPGRDIGPALLSQGDDGGLTSVTVSAKTGSKRIPGGRNILLMKRLLVAMLTAIMVCASMLFAASQQLYQLPDLRSLKHLTTKNSDHAQDIPGKETTMDYYSGTDGSMITVYSFRGRNVAFSTHSNSDVQGTYRLYMDLTGKGLFQQVNTGAWQLPAWVRQ